MRTGRVPRGPRTPRGPFARTFDVRSLKGESRNVDIAASAEECAAVAEAVALPGIAYLQAYFRVSPRAGGLVEVDGRVRAKVTQTCVVTLELFEEEIEQAVQLSFAPIADPIAEPRGRGGHDVIDVAPPTSVGGNDDQEDPPDPIINDTIDLGDVAAEFMVLGLDPYPRKPGVHFDDTVVGDSDEPAPSAFAMLARLKDHS